MKYLYSLLLVSVLVSCGGKKKEQNLNETTQKVAVLLVNHGSHSEGWRKMLIDVEEAVKADLMGNEKIVAVETAHMEYNEPSIATRLKEFDEAGYTDIIVVPIFLTVSSHYSHDIPVIVGLSSDPKIKETLKKEEIEVYKPTARVTITPPLDYTTILKKNVARRVEKLRTDPDNEAVLLVAYGDEQYNQQWEELVEEIGKYLKIKTGQESIAYSWCGHIVRYSSDPTNEGIEKLFELEDRVIVIPILVANDEHFQGEIIQNGVDAASNPKNVVYVQDAILPDTNLNQWVIDITHQSLETIVE